MTDALDVQPPWRWRAFAAHTAPAAFDDQRARALFLAALVGADGGENLETVATALGTSKRTLVRARVWLQVRDPAGWALLRPREAGADAATRARVPGWTRNPDGSAPRARVPGWTRNPDGSAPRARKRKGEARQRIVGGAELPEQPPVGDLRGAEPADRRSPNLALRTGRKPGA